MMQKLSLEEILYFVAAAVMQAKVKNNFRFGFNQNIVKNVTLALIQ